MIGEHESRSEQSGPRWGLEPQLMVVLVVLLLILGALGSAKIWFSSPQRATPEEPAPQSAVETATIITEQDTEPLVVYVSGAVNTPGVIEMAPGQRVVDALQAAGGPTDAAAVEALNLARPLVDGEQLHFPDRAGPDGAGGGGNGQGAGAEPDCVDINTSTSAQLQTLVGIGPALADRIIAHRESAGPFTGTESLLEVSGIGPKIFANLEADLCG